MENAPSPLNQDPNSNPALPKPADFLAVMAESEAAARQAMEVSAHEHDVLEHFRNIGGIALQIESIYDDPDANLTNLAEQAEHDGVAFLERAGRGMTQLYDTLLDAGEAVPWADHYSKNAWFEHSDPDSYTGPKPPDEHLRSETGSKIHDQANLQMYGEQATEYMRNAEKYEDIFPYLDIEGSNIDGEQPVLQYLAERGITYDSTWQLSKWKSGRAVELIIDADVVHEFHDSNTGLTVKIAYGGYRSDALRDAERTPEVIVSDGIHEKHLGEEAWNEVPGIALLLGILQTSKHFDASIPDDTTETIKNEWATAFKGIDADVGRDYDKDFSEADFRKVEDRMLHHLNRNTPKAGWQQDVSLYRSNRPSDARHALVQPVQTRGEALNPDLMDNEFINEAMRYDDDADTHEN